MSPRIFSIATAVLLAAYATAIAAADIQTTVDPDAKFAKYRTFAFTQGDPKESGAIADPRVRERLQSTIAAHLNKKGYQPAAPGKPADLAVHFSGRVAPKQRVLMVGRPGPYSYSWGRSELGGTDTLDYREGTLIVDLADLGQGRLLWRARILQALSAGYSEDNWKKVDQALAEAFKKLPPPK